MDSKYFDMLERIVNSNTAALEANRLSRLRLEAAIKVNEAKLTDLQRKLNGLPTSECGVETFKLDNNV